MVALLVTGPGLPALSSCSRGRARSRTRSWASRSVHPREAMAPRALCERAGVSRVHPQARLPFPTRGGGGTLTICTRSLVPPRWRRSSSSTASQLRTPHLHEGAGRWGEGRGGGARGVGRGRRGVGRGRRGEGRGRRGEGAGGHRAHSLTKCCTSSRLKKVCSPRVTVWTRLSSC